MLNEPHRFSFLLKLASCFNRFTKIRLDSTHARFLVSFNLAFLAMRNFLVLILLAPFFQSRNTSPATKLE
ncbi:hypothetical protein HanHA300_Chr11g0425421 [Helianthus annuus]|nr:hypothetical protein HanHA300_Chr11g0425421 [Helianthus annuus]KAJ0776546.1 hypothetical protein HanLR1_Chr02g0046871 [Helianthus annuus]